MRPNLKHIINISACRHAITEFVSKEVRSDIIIPYWSSLMSEYHEGYHSHRDIILRGLTFLILINVATIISFQVKRDNRITFNFFGLNSDLSKWKKFEKYNDDYKNSRDIIKGVILFFVFFFMRDVSSCS